MTSQISCREPLIRGFLAQSQRTATEWHIHNGRSAAGCRLNGNVAVPHTSSKNHALEGVLQLSEIQAGLRLTAPTAQHQLVSVATEVNRHYYKVYRSHIIVEAVLHDYIINLDILYIA